MMTGTVVFRLIDSFSRTDQANLRHISIMAGISVGAYLGLVGRNTTWLDAEAAGWGPGIGYWFQWDW